MSNEKNLSHGVMEGKGAYNKYAKLPAGGAALALPLLEKAVRSVNLAEDEQPIVIGDYGSSQGKNSLVPMQVAIKGMRQRVGPSRAISIFHVDQPSNDFNSLFEVLDADPDRYCLDEPNVFPAAIGRSFYENVMPPESVHLAWCSYAVVWLSGGPTSISNHFIPLLSTGLERAEFERQGAKDWAAFLSVRSKELRTGGRLVVVLPAVADDGLSGFENIMNQANDVLAEMVAESTITAAERKRMVIRAYPRQRRELLAPFVRDGHFQHLTVEEFEMAELPDAAWIDFEQDGSKEALATKHSLFFRSVFMPSLAAALEPGHAGDGDRVRIFGDRLELGLRKRIVSHPAAMHSFVQIMVLAK